MPDRLVRLNGPIGLVPSRRFNEVLRERRERYPSLPGVDGIAGDLRRMAGTGIPARVARGRNGKGDYLKLFLDGRYVLNLFETTRCNGYNVGDIWPMGFDDHDRVVRSCVIIQAVDWRYHHDIRDLPTQWHSGWSFIQEEWRRLNRASASAAATTPISHQRFLDVVQEVLEEGRRIELTSAGGAKIPYRKVEAAAARRRSARSIYKFRLTGRLPVIGARLHVTDLPELRGRVEDLRGTLISVRFERPVDAGRIPSEGAFTESPNVIGYDKQIEALDALRDGATANPNLLNVVAERRFQGFRQSGLEPPTRDLDPSQKSAFRMALGVPDVGLILGPPGTGKTSTIVEAVLAAVAHGRRVLLTSYTNRAVDNALKELKAHDSLVLLRAGRDEGVTPECEDLTIEAQAEALQQEILRKTDASAASHAVADPVRGEATGWLRQFETDLTAMAAAATAAETAARAWSTAAYRLTEPQRMRLNQLAADAERIGHFLVTATAGHEALRRRHTRAAKWARVPVIGRLFQARVARMADQVRAGAAECDRVRRELTGNEAQRSATEQELTQIRDTAPELAGLRRDRDESARRSERRTEAATSSAEELRGLITGSELPSPAADLAALRTFHERALPALDLMRRRSEVLVDWRAGLARRTEQLYPELVRYADVVGATCIGVATTGALNGIVFDLAIVDEAGQITMGNTLVPLLRARRGVLVGDHRQLPPFAEDVHKKWARKSGDPRHLELVTKSGFELLYPGTPESHHEVLRYQRRMPPVVARFISEHFYGGFLESAVDRKYNDDLFSSPFVVIDTGTLPANRRRERPPRLDEPWAEHGYANDLEADIITELVARNHRAASPDWTVILPFRAQVGLVTQRLTERLGDEDIVAARVGTVDAFQGGERGLIVFGFTRSNAAGKVGFLDEIRRSNVAFSRAQRQLVLIGDFSTLLRGDDPEFRAMAEALMAYVRAHGDLRTWPELKRALEGEA